MNGEDQITVASGLDGGFLHEEPPGQGGNSQLGPFGNYLRKLQQALKRGDATEHTHRPALKELIETLDEKIIATNEPKRSECGAPDYVVSRKRDRLTLGYIEAKDIGKELGEEEKGDQLKRYFASLPNLLLTDYLEFRWFVNGQKRETFRLATIESGGRLAPVPSDKLEKTEHLLRSFLTQLPVDIASAKELAGRLASLTRNIRAIIVRAYKRVMLHSNCATGAMLSPPHCCRDLRRTLRRRISIGDTPTTPELPEDFTVGPAPKSCATCSSARMLR